MKILYFTKGDHLDYQNDCLLIGLKELYGANVVDIQKQQHSYLSYSENVAKQMYGKGMTVTRVLEDLEVDRTDITNKIKNKYFDLIVYGSIWRCNDYIENILEYYSKDKIICVDGEDEVNIHPVYDLGICYFKRELIYTKERLLPISFGLPTSKVNFNKKKIKDTSYITPLDKTTYIYNNETDYYKDYNDARFGVTCKKAGWDCMRHYEILGNGCIPLFKNIELCPTNTMTSFPKELCINVNKDILNEKYETVYEKYIERFENHFLNNNTTSQTAKKFISDILNIK
jgi:hypothetical protein